MRDDRDLVRQAAIEAAKAHGLRAAHGIAEIGGCDFHIHIAPVQAVVGKGGFHHRDGGIARRALRQGADEFGEEVGHVG